LIEYLNFQQKPNEHHIKTEYQITPHKMTLINCGWVLHNPTKHRGWFLHNLTKPACEVKIVLTYKNVVRPSLIQFETI